MILSVIRQISYILTVPDARTGLIARHLVAKLQQPARLGRGQVVRHRFLVSCIVGSNPTAPAIFYICLIQLGPQSIKRDAGTYYAY